jgi:starch phosphorylase
MVRIAQVAVEEGQMNAVGNPLESAVAGDAALERRLHRLGLTSSSDDSWTDRYVLCEHAVDPSVAPARQRFEAVARFARDLIVHRWVKTRQSRERANPKRIYYLSMEFLIGRALNNNIINMGAHPLIERALQREGWSLQDIFEQEADAGLGNGGLGRLAACFIESLATMQYSAVGYGLRYEYGIFRQAIRDGYQLERPDNWLHRPDPWEVARPGKAFQVPLNASFQLQGAAIRFNANRPSVLLGVPYDRPVVGYGAHCVNTLRLWAAVAPEHFDFAGFSQGEFVGAVMGNVAAESITRVLYPDDSTDAGRSLRFLQQYFLVSCSLQDIVFRYWRKNRGDWSKLPEHVAIQLNDTHPSLSVAELMRILMDKHHLGWDDAWSLTLRTLAYTNHTLLPEALEKWDIALFELLIPRHLEIIYEINRRFLDDVRARFPEDTDRVRRMSLIEEEPVRKVRMAHLAVVGTHSTNGVADIHSRLLRERVLRDFADMYPERFNNKTNGITPRRWLLAANAPLAQLISALIGAGWITDLGELRALRSWSQDRSVQERFLASRRAAKQRFVDWLRRTSGHTVDPDNLFDSQIKRIHEYKRQLLNVLHVIVLYNRLRNDSQANEVPRTFFFAGKAAPAYRLAKLIIKLINNVARCLAEDSAVRGRLQVVFVPDYNVSLAERLIPASDVSEQISTAGFEASGTGNMKFMLNGALTVGTRDGATIEMATEAGEENVFLFGLSAEEVARSRGWYDPRWHYEHDPETRAALDLIRMDHFSRDEPGIFSPIVHALLDGGDYYMHLADLGSYAAAHTRVAALYRQPNQWAEKALLNIAGAGKFSSDRTIREYAREIWGAEPSPVT